MNTEIDLLPSPPPPPGATAKVLEDAQFSAHPDDPPERTCPNCGAPAHGPYCYACGQSEKGMIRHLSEVLSDLADIVFNVDSRIFRSLFDLYFRPGFLTTEYIAGRRARYVTPFRLFFFLSIVAFFTIQVVMPDFDMQTLVKIDEKNQSATTESTTTTIDATHTGGESTLSEGAAKKVTSRLERVLEKERDRVARANGNPVAVAGATGADQVNSEQEATSEKDCKGRPAIRFNGKFVSCVQHNEVSFLPAWANAKLDSWVGHGVDNFNLLAKEPRRLVAGWISVLPQTLFVLMPLFAVMLKVFFIFKRRLYMEHLLVALHSHAFIFLGLIVVLGLYLLGEAAAGIDILQQFLKWLLVFAVVWLFVYLLIMQKRVYRQGWIMTVLKFALIGYSYVVVLSIALVISAMVSLAIT